MPPPIINKSKDADFNKSIFIWRERMFETKLNFVVKVLTLQQNNENFMPVISMFYGLIVSMYYLDNKKHKLPHIHVKYGEKEGVYQIPEGILIEGDLPNNKERLLLA